MVDKRFKKIIQSNTGCAVIMAGSDSDREFLEMEKVKKLDSLEDNLARATEEFQKVS